MTHHIFILIFCFCPFFLSAQWKIVEKSKKEQPAWVGGAERNFLIVSAEATTLESAKDKSLLSLKEQVVGAIATHITSQTTQRRQEIVNGNNWDYIDSVSKTGKTSTVSVGIYVTITESGIYKVEVRGTTHNTDGTVPYLYNVTI